MIKTEFRAKSGLEEIYDIVVEKKYSFNEDFENAKKVALAEVEKKFADRKIELENLFSQVSDAFEIEVEDELIIDESIEQVAENKVEDLGE